MNRRGIHTRPERGQSIDWLTPPEILEALGGFDLDPCASALQVRGDLPEYQGYAERLIGLPDDGLTADWSGRVWLNPPYGAANSARWLTRMASHGNGTALVASRTEVERWFVPYVWQAATAVLFLRGRLYYRHPDGTKAGGNAGHGSALVAYGRFDAGMLLISNLPGEFIWLDRSVPVQPPAEPECSAGAAFGL